MMLAEKLCAMFLMYVVGYILIKKQILQIQDSTVLTKIILYVCAPCTIINSFQMPFTMETCRSLVVITMVSILVHIFMIVGTHVFNGITKFNSIERASVIYTNAGYLVIPLVQMVLGSEWVFYTCGYSIVQTFLLWSHCRKLVNEKEPFTWKKVFLNPNLIAIYFGIIIFVTGIRFPAPVVTSINSFANMLAASSMLVIGMLLGGKDIKSLISNARIYFVCFFRLIVYPIFIVLLLKGVIAVVDIPNEEQVFLIVLWAAAAPVGTTVTQFAQLYESDAEYASNINAFSVLVCLFTMPLITMLYQVL